MRDIKTADPAGVLALKSVKGLTVSFEEEETNGEGKTEQPPGLYSAQRGLRDRNW